MVETRNTNKDEGRHKSAKNLIETTELEEIITRIVSDKTKQLLDEISSLLNKQLIIYEIQILN